jgi:hypothetical protein
VLGILCLQQSRNPLQLQVQRLDLNVLSGHASMPERIDEGLHAAVASFQSRTGLVCLGLHTQGHRRDVRSRADLATARV